MTAPFPPNCNNYLKIDRKTQKINRKCENEKCETNEDNIVNIDYKDKDYQIYIGLC